MSEYIYKIYYDDNGSWVEVNADDWTLKRGCGREMYAPILEFETDIKTDIDANTDIILCANFDEEDEHLAFAGYSKSSGTKKRGGRREYEAYHDFYKHADENVNFEDIEAGNYLYLDDALHDTMFADNLDNTPPRRYAAMNQNTYMFWYKTVDITQNGDIFNIVSGEFFTIRIELEGEFIKASVSYETDNEEVEYLLVETDEGFENDKWFHVVLRTWSDEIELLVNGESKDKAAIPANYEYIYREDDIDININHGISGGMFDLQIYGNEYVPLHDIRKVYYQRFGTADGLSAWYKMQETEEDEGEYYTPDEKSSDRLNIGDHELLLRTWPHYEILQEAFPDDYNFNIKYMSDIEIPSYAEDEAKVKDVMQNVIDRSRDYIVFVDRDRGDVTEFWVINPDNIESISLDDYDVLSWEEDETDAIINKVLIYSPKLPGEVEQPITGDDESSINEYGEYAFIYNLEYIETQEEAEAMAESLLSPQPAQEGEVWVKRPLDEQIEMLSARQTNLVSTALDIDAPGTLIRMEEINQGEIKLMVGLGGLYGIQADEREKRSNRWKE